jgi:hypothetical protein
MSDLHPQAATLIRCDHAAILAAQAEHGDECLGAGGWYRYEPAMDPAPGMLYLSCIHCRGRGRVDLPLAGVLRLE